MITTSLLKNAQQRPTDIAIQDDRGQFNWMQVAGMAMQLSAFLRTQTTRDKIAILLPSGLGYVASFYGTLMAGKAVVPINFLLSEREIAHIIADSGIDTIISAPPLSAKLAGLPLKVIDLTQLPMTGGAVPPVESLHRASANELAVLLYTSGTSGLPKGVMLSYGNLHTDLEGTIEIVHLKQNHVFLGVIPLFHSFGMTGTMLAPIHLGAKTIYHARFSAAAMLDAVRTHGASLLFGVPSMYSAVAHLKSATADDFANVYAIISGGEPLPSALRTAFEARFNKPILEGYGLTETSPVVSLNTPEAHRPGSVGKPIPGLEARITSEDGSELLRGQTGEIWLRGPMIMAGYYNLPEETSRALTPDGFFKTGDLGYVDDDGYLHITGRKKDLIIVAGENVAPREIEEVIGRHPLVREVAIVGKKDATRGETIVAFVLPVEGHTVTAEQIRNFCRDEGLPNWKCPRTVNIVEDLPRSPTGKVLKRILSEQANAQPD